MRTLFLSLLLGLHMAAQSAPDPLSDPLIARSLAATCANCHGTDGRARGTMASLAGRPAEAMLQVLSDYKRGSASGTVMPQIVKGYTDEQLSLIATYFAGRPATPRQ